MKVNALLEDLQRRKVPMAIIVAEYGTTEAQFAAVAVQALIADRSLLTQLSEDERRALKRRNARARVSAGGLARMVKRVLGGMSPIDASWLRLVATHRVVRSDLRTHPLPR